MFRIISLICVAANASLALFDIISTKPIFLESSVFQDVREVNVDLYRGGTDLPRGIAIKSPQGLQISIVLLQGFAENRLFVDDLFNYLGHMMSIAVTSGEDRHGSLVVLPHTPALNRTTITFSSAHVFPTPDSFDRVLRHIGAPSVCVSLDVPSHTANNMLPATETSNCLNGSHSYVPFVSPRLPASLCHPEVLAAASPRLLAFGGSGFSVRIGATTHQNSSLTATNGTSYSGFSLSVRLAVPGSNAAVARAVRKGCAVVVTGDRSALHRPEETLPLICSASQRSMSESPPKVAREDRDLFTNCSRTSCANDTDKSISHRPGAKNHCRSDVRIGRNGVTRCACSCGDLRGRLSLPTAALARSAADRPAGVLARGIVLSQQQREQCGQPSCVLVVKKTCGSANATCECLSDLRVARCVDAAAAETYPELSGRVKPKAEARQGRLNRTVVLKSAERRLSLIDEKASQTLTPVPIGPRGWLLELAVSLWDTTWSSLGSVPQAAHAPPDGPSTFSFLTTAAWTFAVKSMLIADGSQNQNFTSSRYSKNSGPCRGVTLVAPVPTRFFTVTGTVRVTVGVFVGTFGSHDSSKWTSSSIATKPESNDLDMGLFDAANSKDEPSGDNFRMPFERTTGRLLHAARSAVADVAIGSGPQRGRWSITSGSIYFLKTSGASGDSGVDSVKVTAKSTVAYMSGDHDYSVNYIFSSVSYIANVLLALPASIYSVLRGLADCFARFCTVATTAVLVARDRTEGLSMAQTVMMDLPHANCLVAKNGNIFRPFCSDFNGKRVDASSIAPLRVTLGVSEPPARAYILPTSTSTLAVSVDGRSLTTSVDALLKRIDALAGVTEGAKAAVIVVVELEGLIFTSVRPFGSYLPEHHALVTLPPAILRAPRLYTISTIHIGNETLCASKPMKVAIRAGTCPVAAGLPYADFSGVYNMLLVTAALVLAVLIVVACR